MTTRTAFATVALFTLLVASSAHAFDGNRKGFILGFGLGGGMASFTQTLEHAGLSATSDRENKGAFATDFKIGAGLNEQFMIYYVARSSWVSVENKLWVFGTDDVQIVPLDEKITILSQVGGLGATYFLSEESSSAYFLGAIGLGSWSSPFESGGSTWLGIGLTGGVGFEFAKHWSAEATVSWSEPSDEEGGLKAESNVISVLVTIQGTAY
jgi:opacity protein-like surface antigen